MCIFPTPFPTLSLFLAQNQRFFLDFYLKKQDLGVDVDFCYTIFYTRPPKSA